MMNFLLFGRGLLASSSGQPAHLPRGQPAITAVPFPHALGRTEFVPARIVGAEADGRPLVEKLGRGGSARLSPLVAADGLAELPAEAGDLAAGSAVRLHPFHAPFAP
jgi:molybdopterin molybdotransferase